MNSEKTNYPLCWPDNWPRTKYPSRARFEEKTIAFAVTLLTQEVNRLNGTYANYDDPKVIVSTNLKPKLSGLPAGGQAQPQDKGAAVYFELRIQARKLPVALACDKWDRVEHNLYAIAKHIEALRAQERWGVGRVEQAFRGYLAIPEKTSGVSWWVALGVDHNATEDQVRARYLELSKVHHPDIPGTGDADKWMAIKQAFDQAQALFRAN